MVGTSRQRRRGAGFTAHSGLTVDCLGGLCVSWNELMEKESPFLFSSPKHQRMKKGDQWPHRYSKQVNFLPGGPQWILKSKM